MIVIIDYGMGNVGSIKNMLKKIGQDSIISSKKEDIKKATKLILPGVGSFDQAMKNLNNLDLIIVIKEKVTVEKTPILGICLGMQLLTQGSEEGREKGFGFIDAHARMFNFNEKEDKLPVPHMGWNKVLSQKESKLFLEYAEQRFYFVHSYNIQCNKQEDILSLTHYGYFFVSSFEVDNIIGVQFHPEKSHNFGIEFFKNFVEKF